MDGPYTDVKDQSCGVIATSATGQKRIFRSTAKHYALMNQKIDLSGDDHAVASWIWKNLVPKSGQASSIQGELLRAVERLRWEAQGNGNINWDEGFIALIDFLEKTLSTLAFCSDDDRRRLKSDLDRLRNFLPVDQLESDLERENLPYVEDDLYDRLTDFVIAFARANPTPLAHEKNPDSASIMNAAADDLIDAESGR